MFKVAAVTACPTGIAHTYMAADILKKTGQKAGYCMKVETQGAMGIEGQLSVRDITTADVIMIASDIDIELAERFQDVTVHYVPINDVLTDVNAVFARVINEK